MELKPYLFMMTVGWATIAAGENLYIGDTSAETQTDTLTRGNFSTELVPYRWDDTTAFDGRKSVRVEWDKKSRCLSTYRDIWYDKWISIANSPDLEMGKPYTFSFYAKAATDKYPLNVELQPCAGWAFYAPGGNYSKRLLLSTEWKRYIITFVPQMKPGAFLHGYSAVLNFSRSPVGTVWYDAVQLEKGSVATPYGNGSVVNVGVALSSPDWSNIYLPSDAVTAMVSIDMPAGREADLTVTVKNYRGEIVKTFRQKVRGAVQIPYQLEINALGWFKVTAELNVEGKKVSSHSVNYIRIEPPVPLTPGRMAYSGLINNCGGEFIPHLALLQKIGVKRVQITARWKKSHIDGIEFAPGQFDWSVLKQQLELGRQHGMCNKVMVSPFDIPDWYLDKKELAEARKTNSLLVLDRNKLDRWRIFISEMMKHCGDLIDEIELGAEDNGRLGHNRYYMMRYPLEVKKNSTGSPFLVGGKPFDDLYAMVKAGAEEIRKIHPQMKIGAIRASRSSDVDDLLFVREVFKRVGREFNILPLDFYFYPFYCGPEIKSSRAPSDGLIKVYQEVKKITAEQGCNQAIYMSEFGWAPDVRYPDDSIYRRDQAETMPRDFIVAKIAGFQAFDWFMGFGGASSINNYSFYMQQNMRIQPVAAAYSAVARVVENVTTCKWYTPDSATRIAVMKKADGSSVAAVWSDFGHDLQLSADNRTVSVTDLMGNPTQPENGQLKLGPAPVYLWHRDFAALDKLLVKARVAMTAPCEVKFKMVSNTVGILKFVNRTDAELKLRAEIYSRLSKDRESQLVRDIFLPSHAENNCKIPLVQKNISVKVIGQDGTDSGKIVAARTFELDRPVPVKSGTNASGVIAEAYSRDQIIPADPWVPWSGSADLSVRAAAAWDHDYLYLRFMVSDDLHFNRNPSQPSNADSLQVAIDPNNDGGFSDLPAPGYGEFALARGNDGKTNAIVSSGKKICLPENYTITRDEQEKVTVYTVKLPWRILGVRPYSGMIFGMSFVIFDDDTGNGQEYHLPVGGGIIGEKSPALYRKYVLQ